MDEIQLCADPDRGHVFTDRLLHARGMVETMFLGAETIRPLLQPPGADGPHRNPAAPVAACAMPARPSWSELPPRTAVVAFSAAEVYAIAELIRRRRGGCAVVMGRLSPRTRNAQVALYQDREVDFLVATDAIGMGLNMDVDHVAFAGLGKFDGHRPRRLTAAEVAQIAGRAGRGMRDGTFGTTAECPPLPDDVVAAVEAHSFDAAGAAVLAQQRPRFLRRRCAAGQPDRAAAAARAWCEATTRPTWRRWRRWPAIRRSATWRTAARRVRLLWDACQIPDFRKLADDTHTSLCARVFGHVARDRRAADRLAGRPDRRRWTAPTATSTR